ncbi:MAG TPA: SNF2-related protein, partial [bacterium]
MENGAILKPATVYEKINHTKKTSGFTRKTEFLPFQKKAFDKDLHFLTNLNYNALLYDMGLGKTITTLYLYDELLNRGMVDHLVVIAPKMLLETWVEQSAEHLGVQ